MGDRHFAGAGVAAGLGTQRDGFRRDPMVCDGAALFYHLFAVSYEEPTYIGLRPNVVKSH